MSTFTELMSAGWLEDLLADGTEDTGPGAVIGVYDRGELVASAARGLASLEHRAPITVDTIFDIASVSKQITATCLVLLQRDGLLSLDDDVRHFVPELSLRQPVTLRQCAQHTGGLRDYLSLVDAVGAPLASVELEPDFLRFVALQQDTNFDPGSDISYSNTGYVLLATVVARVSGRSFQQFAEERVFGPLGMHRSRFRDGLGFVVPDLASSYEATADGYRRADLAEALVGDGATLTSISDLARWQGFLLDGRGLGVEVRDELVAPAVLSDGHVCHYGLGVRLHRFEDRPLLWHGGSMYHFLSELLCLPEDGLGVCVLANRRDVPVGEMARRVARRLLGREPAPSAASPGSWSAAENLEDTWLDPHSDFQVALRPEADGDLTLMTGLDDGRYRRTGDQTWALRFYADLEHQDDDGRVGDTLRWTDHIGRVVTYRRVVRGDEPSRDLVAGRYVSAELEVDLVVDLANGSLTAELGTTDRHAMSHLTQDHGDSLYTAGPMTLRLLTDEGVLLVTGADLQRLRFVRAGER